MKELLPQIIRWTSEEKPFALARVIQTWGSSPRPVGSAMIISAGLEMCGSVSGGCVEGAVLKEVARIIETHGAKVLSYGVNDNEAWSVGLTCGGQIKVYLQFWPSVQMEVRELLIKSLSEDRNATMITALVDDENRNMAMDDSGKIRGDEMPVEVVTRAREAVTRRTHEAVTVGETTYFIQVFTRRCQLLIIGAAHITADLVLLARMYDFETIVIDPREVFAHNAQLTVPPDKTLVEYPSEVLDDFVLDAHTYAVILSHDPKIDDDALRILLRSKVAYIGALGSRKTHEKRTGRLKAAGFSDKEIGRIESPIGIDIHALGAKEIALSIMGSVIRVKNARS